MNDLYIYHHLGLGDHIICNGLIRQIISKTNFDNYYVFTKKHNFLSVKSMFSDIIELNVISVENDETVTNFVKGKKIYLLKIGFENLNLHDYKFDESFYKQVNIPFTERWNSFKINRDLDKEKELFSKYEIEENNYIFLHDDPSRGYVINRDFIQDKKLKVISPVIGYTENMIDYSYIMENAKELHFMDSSFRLLFDSLDDKNQLSYYHTYIRGIGNENTSNSKKNYMII